TYVSRLNRISYRLSHLEVLSRFGDAIVHHQPMDSPVMGDYAYLVLTPDQKTRQEIAEAITASV
ncbi:MAG: carboxylate--amine ligase, partial [Candidatus Riflebacteria bacterium]|nr:carboxylate--amine ligase [Candidatus Riflebacteria bacterium]